MFLGLTEYSAPSGVDLLCSIFCVRASRHISVVAVLAKARNKHVTNTWGKTNSSHRWAPVISVHGQADTRTHTQSKQK